MEKGKKMKKGRAVALRVHGFCKATVSYTRHATNSISNERTLLYNRLHDNSKYYRHGVLEVGLGKIWGHTL